MNTWVLVGISCSDCDDRRVKLLSRQPTENDARELKDEMGGMFCIKTFSVLIEVDGESIALKDDR